MGTESLFMACKFGSLNTVKTLLKQYRHTDKAAASTGTMVNNQGETLVEVTKAGNHLDRLDILYLLLRQDPDAFVKKWKPKDD